MNLMNALIETERLILKPISYEYTENIFMKFTQEITKYMYPKPAENIEETRAFIEQSLKGLENGNNLQMVILNKIKNEFIGCIGLHNIEKIDPELGIWIKKSSYNNGYGLEAINGLIIWTNENVKFEYLKYPVDKNNTSSKKIPERNNGKIMKEYKNIGMKGNELEILEYWIYSKNKS